MWVIWNGVTVAWEVEWFDKEDEKLAGHTFLEPFGEEDMRPVLLVDDPSLCGGYYPIDEARADRLRELADVTVDLGRYDYFLGAADTGLTEPDRSINPSDFPEGEVWYRLRDLSRSHSRRPWKSLQNAKPNERPIVPSVSIFGPAR